MDHLRNALANALGTPPAGDAAGTAAPSPSTPSATLPDPLASPWVARMRELRVDVPKAPTLGQLTQRSDAACRGMEAEGRKREARELRGLKDTFLAHREKAAWALVKERFAELDLSEKTYRSLKQEDALPEKLLEKLAGRRGEALRGAGHQRLRDALIG